MAFLWRGSKQQEVEEASADQTSLGNILIRKGYVTTEQVESAVKRQLQATPPLGEILLEMGAITPDQLEDALYEQRRQRGETTNRDDVQRTLTVQARDMKHVADSLNDIANLSNSLAAKLKTK